MAHTCPICGQYCNCDGDIDDIDFGEYEDCTHCEDDDEDYDEDYYEEDFDEG